MLIIEETYNLGQKLQMVNLYTVIRKIEEAINRGNRITTMGNRQSVSGDTILWVEYGSIDQDPVEDSDQDSPESPDEHPQSESVDSTEVS